MPTLGLGVRSAPQHGLRVGQVFPRNKAGGCYQEVGVDAGCAGQIPYPLHTGGN